jgi:hypothetical protein
VAVKRLLQTPSASDSGDRSSRDGEKCIDPQEAAEREILRSLAWTHWLNTLRFPLCDAQMAIRKNADIRAPKIGFRAPFYD